MVVVGCAHAPSTEPTTIPPAQTATGTALPAESNLVEPNVEGSTPRASETVGTDEAESSGPPSDNGEQPSFRRALASTSLDATTTNGIAHGEFTAGGRPLQARVRVGGPSDLRQMEQTDSCVGNMPVRPQYIVNVSAPVPHLRFFTTGSGGRNDFAIAVGTPGGQLVCRDDGGSETTDPDLDLYDVAPGAYRVWIGDLVLTSGRAEGVLNVTSELRPDRIDATAAPVASTVPFAVGASAQRIDVSAGGDTRVDRELFGMCAGFTTRAPTAVVGVTSAVALMRVYVDNAHDVDTTLLIHGPNDTWLCNDDSFAGDSPTVDVTNAAPGTYQVWVGAYNEHETTPARLNVTSSRREHP